MSVIPARARVVIVGGGVIGTSIAYHLGQLGWSDVVLLERDRGETISVVLREVREAFLGLDPGVLERGVIAYEPLWAIGTGRTATPADAQHVHAAIRGLLVELAGAEGASRIRILYGGSVKPDNAAALLAEPDVDGALVGGAALEVKSFVAIVAAAR